MQAVYDAPPTSPLMEVDVTNMASFIVSLSSPHQSTVRKREGGRKRGERERVSE